MPLAVIPIDLHDAVPVVAVAFCHNDRVATGSQAKSAALAEAQRAALDEAERAAQAQPQGWELARQGILQREAVARTALAAEHAGVLEAAAAEKEALAEALMQRQEEAAMAVEIASGREVTITHPCTISSQNH